MPRGERPLDDGDSPLLLFAADLRTLRTNAGAPSYRELARRAHFSSTTLSDAAGGRKLPALDVTLAYVRACHGDEALWQERWHELAAQLAQAKITDGPSPYVGLKAFETADADRFFGREALTHTLLARLERQNFLAVFGASGEGKSSLLRAGIAPKFSNAVICTPGRDPDATIHEALAKNPDLLVVDQFEELFTLCEDEVQCRAFLDALLGASCPRAIAVRSDFYPHCAEHPDLTEALTDAQVLLGAMSPDEMRRAITQPAATMSCTVETALLTVLIAETTGRSGVLPLVSHALLETWHRRRGNTLTLAGYQAAGGIHGALAQSAEAAYASLDEDQQRLAQQLLLRLSTDGAKRPIPRTEVIGEEVLDVLAQARLITVSEHSVEVTHEALFRAWPRLKAWLEEDQEGLRTHRRLTEAARLWVELGRDAGALYRTTRLAAALDWENRAAPELTGIERDFLAASKNLERRRTHRLRWVAACLAALLVATGSTAFVAWQQRKQVEELNLVTQSQQHAALSDALVTSDPAEAARLAAQSYRAYPTPEARGRLLSTAALGRVRTIGHNGSAYSFLVDEDVVGLMHLDGLQLYDPRTLALTRKIAKPSGPGNVVSWARGQRGLAMVESTGRISVWPTFDDAPVVVRESGPITGVRFLADGSLLAGGTVWDLATRTVRFELPVGVFDGPFSLSTDERLLALVTGPEVALWNLNTRQRVSTTSFGGRVGSVDLLPNSTRAVVTTSGVTQIRDLVTGQVVATPPSFDGPVTGSVDDAGEVLVLSSFNEGRLVLWDIARGVELTSFKVNGNMLGGAHLPDGSLAYLTNSELRIVPPSALPRPPGHTIRALTVDADGTILTLDGAGVLERRQPSLRSLGRVGTGVAQHADGRFSPDRKQVVTTGPLAVRDVSTGKAVADLTAPAFPVASPPKWLAMHGQSVLAVGGDAPDAVWTTGERTSSLTGAWFVTGGVSAATFGRSSTEIVLGSNAGEVIVRDLTSWKDRALPRTGKVAVRALALSPDRRVLAVGDDSGVVELWDTGTWTSIGSMHKHTGAVTALEFSADGQRLASGSADKSVILWGVVGRGSWAVLRGHGQAVTHVAWAPDGSAVVSAAGNELPKVWSLDVDRALRTIG